MTILEKLRSLGFVNSEIVGDRRGVQTVRVMTDKGWAYDRFADAGELDAWAVGKKPA